MLVARIDSWEFTFFEELHEEDERIHSEIIIEELREGQK